MRETEQSTNTKIIPAWASGEFGWIAQNSY